MYAKEVWLACVKPLSVIAFVSFIAFCGLQAWAGARGWAIPGFGLLTFAAIILTTAACELAIHAWHRHHRGS